jgi:Ni/Co efflux regulator RcnB
MKRKTFVITLIAASLGLGGPVLAQRDEPLPPVRLPRHPVDNTQRGRTPYGSQMRDRRDENQARQPDRPYYQGRGPYEAQRDERGAGPDRRFQRGDRLPPEYRHRNYVVNDWRSHNLSAPPRGYQWVQTGSDYLLVAIATGIILQLILNN